MDLHNQLADAIVTFVYKALGRSDAPVAKILAATWVATNTLDANLSKIKFPDGSVVDGIPKNVSTTGLTAGDPVLVIRGPGVPMTIICKYHGDITVLAQ